MSAIVKKYNPTSPGQRHRVTLNNKHLSSERPMKALTSSLNRISGRNNQGRITVRHRGGAHKRLYREVDFKRIKDDVPARVERLEYDPNRSAHLALIVYKDGQWAYIIAPKNLKENDTVVSGKDAPIAVGNTLPLTNIPVGSIVHCVEMRIGKGAQLARSAGAAVSLLGKESGFAILRLRSGETRKVHLGCRATIGEVSNSAHSLQSLGKAGASRWRGIRPTVRGVAMNPIDHPHGGGEGRTSGGRHPVSPTGVGAKGKKTRKVKRTSKMIVRRRDNKRG